MGRNCGCNPNLFGSKSQHQQRPASIFAPQLEAGRDSSERTWNLNLRDKNVNESPLYTTRIRFVLPPAAVTHPQFMDGSERRTVLLPMVVLPLAVMIDLTPDSEPLTPEIYMREHPCFICESLGV
jgi:hypothetical protein